MADKLSVDDALDGIGNWTLLELSDFIKKFEDRFDVQAAAMAAPMAMPGTAAGGEERAEEEEKTEFTVVLSSAGDKKIQVIKEVRALTNLGLKEAKDLVDGAPNTVLENVPKEQADAAKEALEAAGGSVEIK